MKKGYLIIFLILSVHAQQDERIIGKIISELDLKTMKKIEKPYDVRKEELIAAYCILERDWFYAEVTTEPNYNFYGQARFVKNGLQKNFAINFSTHVAKLLTKKELQEFEHQKKSEPEQQKKAEYDSCSLQ
jgi:hypothetical protein